MGSSEFREVNRSLAHAKSFHITNDRKILTGLKGKCLGSKKPVRRLFQSSIATKLTEYGRSSRIRTVMTSEKL